MIRRFLTALLLIVPGFLYAQSVIGEIRFDPPAFYVGDPVELRVSTTLGENLPIEVPDEPPESEWAEIHDISLEYGEGSLDVVISFTPFAAGTRTLPDIDLGVLRLQDLKVPTHSVLENSHDGVRTLRGQRLLPGTRLAVALILALIAMTPFLGYLLFRITRAGWTRFRGMCRKTAMERRLKRRLRCLKNSVGTMVPVAWYSDLTSALRDYLSLRTGTDCRSSTTAEVAKLPGFLDAEDPRHHLLEVLKEGDMVKFAGRTADDRSLRKTLETVESSMQEWEKMHVEL